METKYTIKTISEDGLLKDVKDGYGYGTFASKYPSKEAAVRAIEEADVVDCTDLIILEVYTAIPYWLKDNA